MTPCGDDKRNIFSTVSGGSVCFTEGGKKSSKQNFHHLLGTSDAASQSASLFPDVKPPLMKLTNFLFQLLVLSVCEDVRLRTKQRDNTDECACSVNP